MGKGHRVETRGSAGWVDFWQVKQSISLATVLTHYQWQWVRRRGDGVQGRCPIHGGQREDAFHADLNRGVFHCFSCQAHGSVLDLVASIEKCTLHQAALRMRGWWGEIGPVWRATGAGGELVREKVKVAALRFSLHPIDNGCAYLKERGIEMQTARYFGVGQYSGPGLMHGRVVIPIHDEGGRLVAYAGRSIDGTSPKYKLPAGFQKSEVLFNLHRARALGQKRVIVVEGFFDCLKVHQAGLGSVVALMGCGLSRPQQKLLLESFDHVVLMLDADAAGQGGAAAAARQLGMVCEIEVIQLPIGQPDQLSAEQIHRALATPANCSGDLHPRSKV